MNKKIKNIEKSFLAAAIILFLFVTASSLIFAAESFSVVNTQYFSPSSTSILDSTYSSLISGTGASLNNNVNNENYFDLAVMIPPAGCQPYVVRSDLLEEQNVPVFCQLMPIKINPGIDINRIERVSVKKVGSNDYISGVAFHPAQAAIKSKSNSVNTPTSDNLGYVVVVLKKQPNEKLMPETINATLAISLEYGANYAFGIGENDFYVPVLDDAQFYNQMQDYSFFEGLGYLRVENIDDKGATISVYDNYGKSSSGLRRVFSDRIETGKTSRDFYIYSSTGGQGLRFILKDITIPEVKAKIRVNGRSFDVYKGGKFYDGRCTLTEVRAYTGGTGYAKVNCGGNSLTLQKTFNKVSLQVGATSNEENLIIGQEIKGLKSNNNSYYLAYAGQNERAESFIILLKLNNTEVAKYNEDILKQKILDLSRQIDSNIKDNTGIVKSDKLKAYIESNSNSASGFNNGSLLKLSSSENPSTIENQQVTFKGLKSEDKGLNDNKLSNYFENSLRDYDYVKDGFGAEKTGKSNYGEQALWAEYDLAVFLSQKAKANSILSRIENEYPSSIHKGLSARALISSGGLLSNEDSSQYDSKNDLYVELVSVNEPSSEEASVSLHINGEPKILYKNGILMQDTQKGRLITLTNFDENGISVSYSCKKNPSDANAVSGTARGRGNFIIQDCDANIVVDKINLKKVAHVEIVPNVKGRSRESNFSFSIGIEKRALALNLTPAEANKKIEELNKQIADIKNITESLSQFIKAEKAACLATTGIINVINLISGIGGEATARQEVMKRWNALCSSADYLAKYSTTEDCIAGEYETNIKKEIEDSKKIMSDYNTLYKQESTSEANKNNKKINDTLVKQKIIAKINVNDNIKLYNEKGEEIKCQTPYTQGAETSCADYIGEIISNKNINDMSYNEVSDLYFSLQMAQADIKSAPAYSSNAYSKLKQIELRKENENTFNLGLSANGGLSFKEVDTFVKNKDSIEIDYTGRKFKELPNAVKAKIVGVSDFERVSSVVYLGGTYVYVLEGTERNLGPNKIYDVKNNKLLVESGQIVSSLTAEDEKKLAGTLKNVRINIRDANSYKNKCKNCNYAKVFTTEPYKGMPSLIPFDCENGWYVQTKQDFPGLDTGNVKTFQDSGRVNSFYLCNVGFNGLIEGVNIGDDICSRFDLYTGNTLDAFGGLTQEQARSIVSRAIKAIENAQSQLTSNPNKITMQGCDPLTVKEAEGDIGTKCTDFMSPKQCQLIFNVCDPVICPNSRCDFGGTYKVDNVIQSGIIGSTFLCLPNFIGFHPKTGVVIPVCLTGINAGLEGWSAILELYRDCINESVANNKTVGICDAVHSVYLCDFFWRQAGPLVQTFTKNLFYTFFGRGDHGGGEYLFVQDAWNKAEKSVQYFQTTYGKDTNLKFGFNQVSNIVADEVCKMSASASYPDSFDAMLEPESPAQFHAFFEELSYTDATVPARSQYKVTYIIYSGNQGHSYQVYLKSAPTSLGYVGKDYSVVDSGYVAKGGKLSQSKDFIDVSGFKELCVKIDLKEKCGFKSVSTSAALNYMKNQVVATQASSPVSSESECIAGSTNLGSFLTPNIQQAAEEALNPELYNQGIIRVCANEQPAKTVDPGRWKNIGNCGDRAMGCWVDTQSITKAIQGAGLENYSLSRIENLSIKNLVATGGYLPLEQVKSKMGELIEVYVGDSFDNPKGVVGSITINPDNKKGSYPGAKEGYVGANMDNLDEHVRLLDKSLILSSDRAELYFTRARIYDAASRKLNKLVSPSSSNAESRGISTTIPNSDTSTPPNPNSNPNKPKTYIISEVSFSGKDSVSQDINTIVQKVTKISEIYNSITKSLVSMNSLFISVKHDCDNIKLEKEKKLIGFIPWFSDSLAGTGIDDTNTKFELGKFEINTNAIYNLYCLDSNSKEIGKSLRISLIFNKQPGVIDSSNA